MVSNLPGSAVGRIDANNGILLKFSPTRNGYVGCRFSVPPDREDMIRLLRSARRNNVCCGGHLLRTR